jgi:hypothetical protein
MSAMNRPEQTSKPERPAAAGGRPRTSLAALALAVAAACGVVAVTPAARTAEPASPAVVSAPDAPRAQSQTARPAAAADSPVAVPFGASGSASLGDSPATGPGASSPRRVTVAGTGSTAGDGGVGSASVVRNGADRTAGDSDAAFQAGDPHSHPASDTRQVDSTPTPQSSTAPPAEGPGKRQTVTGVVVRTYVESAAEPDDHDDESHAGAPAPDLLTWIDTGDDHVQVPTPALRHVPDGALVSAVVRDDPNRADGTLTAAGAYPVVSLEILALDAANPDAAAPVAGAEGELDRGTAATATREVTVVLAVPKGMAKDSTSATTVRDLVNGPVNGFWSEQTTGAIGFKVVRTVNWISLSATCSDAFGMWDEAAAAAGFTRGTGKHLLLYIPREPRGEPGCSYGLGTIGSSSNAGGMAYVRDAATHVIAHELGHNLGLRHSDGLVCPRTSDATYSGGWSDGCTEQSYRDWYEIMGISWSQIGSLSVANAHRLGVMPASVPTVTTPTYARLQSLSARAGLRGLRLQAPDGSVYFVEYRAASGRDQWLSGNTRGLQPGVIVRRVNPRDSRMTVLLDPSPTGSLSDWSQSMGTGGVMSLARGHFTVRVDAVDSAGADVRVAVGGVWPAAQRIEEVRITGPATGTEVVAGQIQVTGTATATEGTLLWEVTDSAGAIVRSGFTTAGANGDLGRFSFATTLPSGRFTIAVWAPDESDGESGEPARRIGSSTTITVRPS